jgi:hypothetical protein
MWARYRAKRGVLREAMSLIFWWVDPGVIVRFLWSSPGGWVMTIVMYYLRKHAGEYAMSLLKELV